MIMGCALRGPFFICIHTAIKKSHKKMDNNQKQSLPILLFPVELLTSTVNCHLSTIGY